jgi:hypothetical protein
MLRCIDEKQYGDRRLEMPPTIRDQERQAALVQMAQVWLRLAEEKQASAPPIEQDRLAVQQQQ